MKKPDNKSIVPIIVAIIGVVGSFITIFAFTTGKQSLRDALQKPARPTETPMQVLPPKEPLAMPRLTFLPCATSQACPTATSIFTALGEPKPYDFNAEYSLEVNHDLFIRFSQGWCTKDQSLLHDHISH